MRPECVTCVYCGIEAKIAGDGPIPKYCSAACRRAASHERCRRNGRYAASLAEKRERTRERQAQNARPCPYCGNLMTHSRRVQCGAAECKRRYVNERMREYQRRYKEKHGYYQSRLYDRDKPKQFTITCQQCGREAVVTKREAKYCSHTCFYDARYGEARPREDTREVARLRRRTKAAARLEQAAVGTRGKGVWTVGRCSSCGTRFTRHSFSKPVAYCSPACRRREKVMLRRALRYDLDAGRVSRIAIYQRDDWTCHICGDPVDRDAVVPDLAAPVLDHVVPLARGGSHSEANLMTAHFYCNSVKRDLAEGWSALAG